MTKVLNNFTFEVEDKYGNIINVSARIEKEGGCYCWYTSHLTKPQDADGIGFYRPSNQESSLVAAKGFLESYICMMRRSKVMALNEYY